MRIAEKKEAPTGSKLFAETIDIIAKYPSTPVVDISNKKLSHPHSQLFLCQKWAFSVSQQMNTMPIA